MKINKQTETLNMPWEKEYGYYQAVKVGDTIYLSGQVSHDETGNIIGVGDMERQMRQAYKNVRILLTRFEATMDDVVDEVLFVTDMEAAFAARRTLGQQFFSSVPPALASTIVQIERLAFPELMVEIKCVAKVENSAS